MRNAMVPAVLILLLCAFPGVAQTTPCSSIVPVTPGFTSTLLGSNVANNFGAANAFASAALTFNGNQATLNVNSLGLGSNITAITLFQGQPGAGGTPIMTFTDQNNLFVNGSFSRTIPLDQNLVNQIEANPSNFFFAIDTSQFPNGAVVGQLAPSAPQLIGAVLSGTNINGGAANASGTMLITVGPSPMPGNVTLTFDILTNGIGNNFNSVSIMPASGGASLLTLSNLPAATNGRLIRSVDISRTLANQILSNPCSFIFALSTPAFPNGAIAGSLGATNEIFIPVVGSVTGANGTNFMTDLSIFDNSAIGVNTPGATANVFAQFFPSGPISTPVAQNVATLSIPPRGTATLRDINTSMFNGALNGIGALRIISSGSVLANARIFNNQIASGHGTFGQFVPGMLRSQALQQGLLVGVGNVGANGAATVGGQSFRTNIGFFNPNATPTTVALELRDNNGAVLGNATVNLGPFMHTQMPLVGTSGAFSSITGDVPTATVFFLSGNPIFAYASLIDNTSGDASFITPSFATPFTPAQ